MSRKTCGQTPTWKGRYILISLPGAFEEPKAPVYVDGRLFTTLKGDRIVPEFIGILDQYVDSHYAARAVEREEVGAKV